MCRLLVMRGRRNVVLTPRVCWAHGAWGNLGKVSPELWPPQLLSAAASCRPSPAPALRTLHLRHRQVLPSSQHLTRNCGEIHWILILIVISYLCLLHIITDYTSVFCSWFIDCPMSGVGPPDRQDITPFSEFQKHLSSHETWQQQKRTAGQETIL